jgi:hypothetical protein
VSIAAAAHTAIMNLSYLRADAHDGVVLLAVATGVIGSQLLGPVIHTHARRWLAAWAVFLLAVPWLITAALTAWGGSTESGGHSPFRAASLPVGCVAVALMLVVWLALSRFPTFLARPHATLLALALVTAGGVGLAHKAGPIIRAESMRTDALDRRASSIQRQLTTGEMSIKVVPAPLLTVLTQAYDLSFAPTHEQRSGWTAAFRQGYGIPTRDAVDVVATQPRGYCLPGVDASWVGVRSCQELDASR